MTRVHPALAKILETHREALNQVFLREWRLNPSLEPGVIQHLTREYLSPMVALATESSGSQAEAFTLAGFTALVTLQAKGASTLGEWGPLGEQVWKGLWNRLMPHLLREPNTVLPALLNGVWSMTHPRKDVEGWIQAMGTHGPLAPDGDTLLKMGQVLAWIHGQAQYREGAMGLLDGLPPPIRSALLPGTDGDTQWKECRSRLMSDPWHVPGKPASGFRFVAEVGAFRGLGGCFAVPPEVVSRGNNLFARSGSDFFILHADGFGHSIHRTAALPNPGPPPPIPPPPPPSLVDGNLMFGGKGMEGPFPGRLTSWAHGPNTLAFTTTHSHRVFFVAKT